MSLGIFPNIQTSSIYEGKFMDWMPSLKAAGKLTATGDTAAGCMRPKSDDRPTSSDVVRIYRRTHRPDPGQRTTFYGKSNDPQLKLAEEMCHGVNTHASVNICELINPLLRTFFKQKLIDKKESCYASNINAPLGCSHDQRVGLPRSLDCAKSTFGKPTQYDSGASDLINPDKSYRQVESDSAEGHDKYILSHKDYFVGERVNRNYSSQDFSTYRRYGKPTPHDETGRMVRNTLKWTYETEKGKAAKIVPRRLEDFREKSQPEIGKFIDPIKETLNVPSDHIYGILLKPDEYGAGDLIHQRVPGKYLRGRDHQRGLVAAMRHQLKRANYHNFSDLIRAFQFYDKAGKGTIDVDDLREACLTFNLPIDVWLLEQVFDYCDVDGDGKINYLEFSNFLNWKENLPSGFAELSFTEQSINTSPVDRVTGQETTLVTGGDLTQLSPQNCDRTAHRLQKQIDKAVGYHHTTSGMIGSTAVNLPTNGTNAESFRTYGVPSIRSDLAPPRLRRIDDRQNYGDQSDAWGLTNPSIYSTRGVYEKDLLLPRSENDIKDIFSKIGVHMTGETLQTLYQQVSAQHPKGHVSVESFRNALDETMAAKVSTGEHPLAV